MSMADYQGPISTIDSVVNSANLLTIMAIPLLFLVSLYVMFSNFDLMRKEGVTWRNMLGIILGVFLLAGSILPIIFFDRLQATPIVELHDQSSVPYLISWIEHAIAAMIAYLECILISTIICCIKAARAVPDFDRDYILILGCMVLPDGTLTKLLQGRADRAIEFAKMQKEATGKDIIFVPSGGKGSDEPISEGEAIANYLYEQGIPKDHVLIDDKSANTDENFRCSLELIRQHSKKENPNIAFSTTNYHVFRSGVIAHNMGIEAQGIGAKTKSYFWINAFIREFVAILNNEKKLHMRIFAIILMILLVLEMTVYFAYQI